MAVGKQRDGAGWRRFGLDFGVPDIARRHHEDDVLGDVGGVIADALEMPRDEDEIERGLDGGRILQHEGEELPEDLRLEPVERIVVVRASVEDGRIRVTVGDSGRWAPPVERDDRGLGLRLMEALVTSVAVAESPSGTTVTLEKELRPAEPAAP